MTLYALTHTGGILREDGAVIPPDPANVDYARFLGWVSAGHSPAPAAPPPVETSRFVTKFVLYSRMTDFELEALDAFLHGVATTRQRLQWTDALEIDCLDPQIIGFATSLFGAPRALEILK